MREHTSDVRPTRQGEALLTWAVWGVLLVVMGVTYARLDPVDTYHVSRGGLVGALSRVLVEVNFPIALVAIALVLVALDALPRRAWWLGAPAIALCAVTAWPGVVDDGDLDARLMNAVPAVGVALALGLTVAAARVAGNGGGRLTGRMPFDGVRAAVGAVALVLAIPWIAADLGVFLPHVVFVMDTVKVGADGVTSVAVHLGHHHGMDAALLVVSAALLSRVRLRSTALARVFTPYVALVFVYGAVNLAQDFWNEQIVSRGWTHWQIPSALVPAAEPVWLVVLALTAVVTVLLRHGGTPPARPQSVP